MISEGHTINSFCLTYISALGCDKQKKKNNIHFWNNDGTAVLPNS